MISSLRLDKSAAPTNDAPRTRPIQWHAGTLGYTFAGIVALFCWLLGGDFTYYLKERSVPAILQVLFEQFKASDFVNGLVIGTLPQVLSLVLNPVISYRSDRHRGRWGRRIPFLIVPVPIAVLSMIGLAYSPAMGRALHQMLGARSPGENVSIVICLSVCWTLFEVSSVITNSVLGGLINDVVPRALLGRFFGLFRIFSLSAGMAFGYFLFGRIEKHYRPMFLAIAALYAITFTAMCLRVKEGEYPPVAQDTRASLLVRFRSAMAEYFTQCFSASYYRWFFLSFTLAQVAFLPINLFYVRYATSMGVSKDVLGKYASIQFFCSLVQAYPLGWLCDKFHSIRMTMIALVLYGLATLSSFFFVQGPVSFGVAFVLCGTLAGFWLTTTAPLGPMLLPKASFATFVSATHVCVAVAVIVVSPLCGWLLDRLDHQYRFIFIWASFFGTLSLIAMAMVYRMFMRLGGPSGYVAPEAR